MFYRNSYIKEIIFVLINVNNNLKKKYENGNEF